MDSFVSGETGEKQPFVKVLLFVVPVSTGTSFRHAIAARQASVQGLGPPAASGRLRDGLPPFMASLPGKISTLPDNSKWTRERTRPATTSGRLRRSCDDDCAVPCAHARIYRRTRGRIQRGWYSTGRHDAKISRESRAGERDGQCYDGNFQHCHSPLIHAYPVS
jgi:hypothetical protein